MVANGNGNGAEPAQVGATTAAKLPAVQRTDDVPEYPAEEQFRVQLAPLATSEAAQSLVYASVPEPPSAMNPVQGSAARRHE